MEKCLGCKREFREEQMINTYGFLGEVIDTDFAGLFCKNCISDKEICSYCGQPVEEIVYKSGTGNSEMSYCQECFDEVEEYLKEKY